MTLLDVSNLDKIGESGRNFGLEVMRKSKLKKKFGLEYSIYCTHVFP